MTAPDPADPAEVSAFVMSHGTAVVSTVTPDHRPQAAFVGVAALVDGTIVFDTPADSRKARNLRATGRAAVVVGLTGDLSVQIEGAALAADGEHRQRLADAYEARHPGSRAHDPAFDVVAIAPEWVRVHDATTHPATVREATWSSDG